MGAARPEPGAGRGERLVDACAHAEQAYGVRYSGWGMSRLLRRLGLSRQKARPWHPQGSAAERSRAPLSTVRNRSLGRSSPKSPKPARACGCGSGARMRPGSGRRGGSATAGTSVGCARPGWPTSGSFESLYLFAACRPGTDQAFALALPEATTAAMGLLLAAFAEQLEPDAHAVLILDQAGWHGSRRLTVPGNITPLPLPAYSPELDPVERVRLCLRERFLSHRVLDGYKAVLDAACDAWNALAAETGRLTRLTAYPYLLRPGLR